MNQSRFIFYAMVLLSACQTVEPEKDSPQGPFFGIKPTAQPQLLAPGFLPSGLTQYNGTFSPDGTEFFYTSDTPVQGFITSMQILEDGSWGDPEIAPFSGIYSEYDPLFSPDGNRLYFSSTRPVSDTLKAGKSNIWYVERLGKQWSDPLHIPLTSQGDYYSSITNQGAIYFNVWSTGDMYKAIKTDSTYQVAKLPKIVNTTRGEGDPFIAPDESYLIFRGYRDDSYGRGDLYITFNMDSTWTEPKNLGPTINSEFHEMCPYVTSDGKIFVYASNRLREKYDSAELKSVDDIERKFRSSDNGNQNIYYMSTDFIQDLKKEVISN